MFDHVCAHMLPVGGVGEAPASVSLGKMVVGEETSLGNVQGFREMLENEKYC